MQQMETLPSGTILHGRYRVERPLGSGGFGHVYLSLDLQTNTLYAIKEYLVTGAGGKAQLEHEADVLSHLHHPNLPAFLSSFDENGRYYVILGYIEGNDLTDYLRVARQKNEPIQLARLMEWLLSICDAVAFLHSQRPPIIHRDIKPDNIRITPSGTAILVDLGNAKTAADGARTLVFIRHQGTPGYAPLEQYPGGTGTDERSDIYALGGTLYFALTAHEPPSVSARNQSLQQKQPDLPTLQDRLTQNPPDNQQEPRMFRLGVSKPSKPAPRHSRHLAQLGTLPPELLRKLDAIIHRAMAMKPKDRYTTVTEFSSDLRVVLRALPSSTLPPTQQRPVDPHSTQPDLPMLYEEMQNKKQAQAAQAAQANQPGPAGQATPSQTGSSGSTGQSSQPGPAGPTAPPQAGPSGPARQPGPAGPATPPQVGSSGPASQSSQPGPTGPAAPPPVGPSTPPGPPPTPAPSAMRCPHCSVELNRPAPYCPNCGKPLNPPTPPRGPAGPSDPGKRQGGRNMAQDISEEATMLIPPGSSLSEPPGPNRRPGSSAAPNGLPRGGTNAHRPASKTAQQRMLKTPSQSVPAVRPAQPAAMNRPAHQAPGASTGLARLNASRAPGQAGAYTAVKPSVSPAQSSLNEQIQIPARLAAPAGAQNQQEGLARKLFISAAIILVALIIVMLLLIVFLHTRHITTGNPAQSIQQLTGHILARLAHA